MTRPGWAGAGRGPAARRSVVVLGSANVDLVVSVDRRPGAGETVLGADVRTFAGGKGANQAVAAGRLGGRVTFAGCVGRDAGAGLLRGSLAAAGVDLTHLRESAAPTGTALILLTPDGENSIVVSPGANRMVTADLVAELDEVWPHAAVLVVQLEIPMETVELAVRRAAQAGVRVVVNAAPAAALSSHALKRADPLVVNETEAAFLLGLRPGTAAGDGTEGDDGDRGGGGGGGDDDDDGEAVLAAGRLLAAGRWEAARRARPGATRRCRRHHRRGRRVRRRPRRLPGGGHRAGVGRAQGRPRRGGLGHAARRTGELPPPRGDLAVGLSVSGRRLASGLPRGWSDRGFGLHHLARSVG